MTKDTNKMTKEQAIKKYINEMEVLDLRDVVISVNCYDGGFDWLAWEDLDNLDDVLCDMSPTKIIDLILNGDFRNTDDYFRFDGYGNLETCSEFEMKDELNESRDEIAEYLCDFQGDLWDDTLQNIIDSPDEAMFNEEYQRID